MKSRLAFFLLFFSVAANAADWVNWSLGARASVLFAELLAQAATLDEVTVTGYSAQKQFDSAECIARVLRPGREDSDLSHAENRIVCSAVQGETNATIELSLAGEPISPWGHFGSPRAFSIRGRLVRSLALLIQQRMEKEPEHPLLHHLDFSGPAGHRILSYDIRYNPDRRLADGSLDYSPLVVSCGFNVQNTDLHSSYCHFLVFD